METLVALLNTIPGVRVLSNGQYDDGPWWVKLTIDVHHALAWRVVQELGHVLNLVSIEEPLPTRFYPVSPPPYMNGGPEDFLSWIIEATDVSFAPSLAAEWISGRLPRPIDDARQWSV
jgi:hypothetical protein